MVVSFSSTTKNFLRYWWMLVRQAILSHTFSPYCLLCWDLQFYNSRTRKQGKPQICNNRTTETNIGRNVCFFDSGFQRNVFLVNSEGKLYTQLYYINLVIDKLFVYRWLSIVLLTWNVTIKCFVFESEKVTNACVISSEFSVFSFIYGIICQIRYLSHSKMYIWGF